MYDVIVLGAGGIGSAAAYHLARRGQRVLAIDRFTAGHDRGSSHGETRVIRQAYFEHEGYVPLLRRGYDLWHELEQLTGARLFEQIGLLEVGPGDGIVVPGVLKAAMQHSLSVERLTRREAVRRFPVFRIPEGMEVVFEPTAGYLKVEQCVLAHLAAAKMHGCQFRWGTSVLGWTNDASTVRVQTDHGDFSAARLVVAAGPWSPQLLGNLGVRLQVLRKHVSWLTSNSPLVRQDAGCPTYLFEMRDGVFYGFPQVDSRGVKVAEHSGGETVHQPDAGRREADQVDEARVSAFVSECLPEVGPPIVRRSVCYYTMSPDGHFLVVCDYLLLSCYLEQFSLRLRRLQVNDPSIVVVEVVRLLQSNPCLSACAG